MVRIAFNSYFSECDPDAAALALRKAGFTVRRMPVRLQTQLPALHPLDDFMFVSAGRAPVSRKGLSAVVDEVNSIVNRYAGLCHKGEVVPVAFTPTGKCHP
jgi:hypothetical protein